ncbi:MAG TPA: hypothetical protein VMU54_07240 [Planctomycetota bacterium]|nr:hypothetical protein [Planctomycetota bacterium]
MNALLWIVLLAGFMTPDLGPATVPLATTQESSGGAAPSTERIELRKDGGPGHGPDQPYSVREIGARDLERFVGGKQVVFIEPFDYLLLVLLVVIIVVLVLTV